MVWRAWRTASAVTAQVLMTGPLTDGRCRLAADHLEFGGGEPAAEGDDVDGHCRGPTFDHAKSCRPGRANSAGSKVPSRSYSAGPVISTWSSVSRHSMRRSPPGKVTVTTAAAPPRGRDRNGASGGAAGPGEPAPRSHVRTTM